MLHDRGNMKWTSLMLPEHLVQLKEWKKEEYYDEKRDLTEWEIGEIEQTIQLAFKLRKLVKLTLRDHIKLHDHVGLITGTDKYKKELLLETDLSIKRRFLFEFNSQLSNIVRGLEAFKYPTPWLKRGVTHRDKKIKEDVKFVVLI